MVHGSRASRTLADSRICSQFEFLDITGFPTRRVLTPRAFRPSATRGAIQERNPAGRGVRQDLGKEMKARAAFCGSTNAQKRPTVGMSFGGTVMLAPSFLACSAVASALSTCT